MRVASELSPAGLGRQGTGCAVTLASSRPAGRARVPGSDQGLPAPRGADPEGGVALPGHLRPLLQRGYLHPPLHPG